MTKCKRCGTELKIEDILCKGCGKTLTELRSDNEIVFEEESLDVEVDDIDEIKSVFNEEIIDFDNEINNELNAGENAQTIVTNNELNAGENVQPIGTNDESQNVEPLGLDAKPIEQIYSEPIKEKVDDKPKKKSKATTLFLVLVLVILVLAGVFFYFYKLTAPKQIFNKAIDKVFTMNNEKIKEFKTADMTVDFDMLIQSEQLEGNPIVEFLNNLSFNLNTKVDTTNKKSIISFDTTYRDSELLKGSVYTKDSDAYVYLDNVYDKYIHTTFDETSTAYEVNDTTKEIKIVMEELQNELKNTLDSKYLTREIKKYNGEYVTIATLKFDKKSNEEYFDKLISSLSNNDKFFTNLSAVTGEDTLTLKQNLKDTLTGEEELSETYNLEISIYTNLLNGKIVRVELNEKDKDDFSIELDINESYEFKIKINEQSYTAKLNIMKDDLDVYVLNIKNDQTMDSVEFTLKFKLEYDKEIADIDVTNSVNLEEIPEEEFISIYENILSKDGIIKILELFPKEEPNEEIYNDEYYFE